MIPNGKASLMEVFDMETNLLISKLEIIKHKIGVNQSDQAYYDLLDLLTLLRSEK